MRTIRSLLGLLVGLVVLGGVASAIAAVMTKRHLVSRGAEEDDEVDLVVIFDGLDFASRAAAFTRGSVLTWYGGATVDLTGATLPPEGAVLDVRTMFGGLQLIVPPSWPVDVQVVSVFAGVADTRDAGAVDETAPRLLLTGWAAMGGVGVMTSDAAGEPVAQAAEAGAGG
jgi:hypothetical protein